MQNRKTWLIGGAVFFLVLCLCGVTACLVTGGVAALGFTRSMNQATPGTVVTREVQTIEAPVKPTSTPAPGLGSTLTPQVTLPAPDSSPVSLSEAEQTLKTLEEEVVPINDPLDLALRLEGKDNIPGTVSAPQTPYSVGQEQVFWATNVDTNQHFQVNATLRYVTPHLYFWVENGVGYDERAIERLAENFENKIYPTNRAFFGSEWSPGIDNDEHLYVLYAGNLGGTVAGYFSPSDELPPQVHRYSNAHEMFKINADLVRLDRESINATMAHEFQHMIHWYGDRNEDSWVNEGFSMLAELLNGYDVGGFDYIYASDPDLQLTLWPQPPASRPHYGASFLFMVYFLDRFGEEATQALVAHPDNGMDGIDQVLDELASTDPQTGQALTANDVFGDWVVANLVNDGGASDGRFAYQRYDPPAPAVAEEVNNCTPDWQPRSVKQFGVDYIPINCRGSYTLEFQGSSEVQVLPVDAYSGDYAFWSNKGDESDMTLTRTFDFTQASTPLTLQFRTWFNLEEDYDYLYLAASADGKDWQILQPARGRDRSQDPTGNAYGWGYNGQTGEWVEDSVDLSAYAGKQVQLRFEYVTDAAVNGEGFLLDDVSIPEVGYFEDFEQDEGGWQGDGFVRIQNRLPQSFVITLVQDGREIAVQRVLLDENLSAQVPVELGGSARELVLVVSGVTRFTTQPAGYQFRFVK